MFPRPDPDADRPIELKRNALKDEEDEEKRRTDVSTACNRDTYRPFERFVHRRRRRLLGRSTVSVRSRSVNGRRSAV